MPNLSSRKLIWAQRIVEDIVETCLTKKAICFEMPHEGTNGLAKDDLMGFCKKGKWWWWIAINVNKHESAEELYLTVIHEMAHAQSMEEGESLEANCEHCEDWEHRYQDLLLQFPLSLYEDNYPC